MAIATMILKHPRIAPHRLGGVLAVLLALLLPAPASAGTQLRFETVLGDFSVELFDALRPVSVKNFLDYVNDGDYSDSIVHRSVPGFVIQGGGYYLDGSEIPPKGDAFQDIPGPSNLRGTLAMAENVDGATSQWFINLDDNTADLDANFTVFGEVTQGMEVVDAIAALPTFPFLPVQFEDIPLRNYTLDDYLANVPLTRDNLVIIQTIPEPGASLQLLIAAPLLALLARRAGRGALSSASGCGACSSWLSS